MSCEEIAFLQGETNNCDSSSSSFSDEGSEDDENAAICSRDNNDDAKKHTCKLGWKESNVIVTSSDLRDAVTVAELGGESHYAQSPRRAEGSSGGHKDMVVEEGVGLSGRKEVSHVTEPVESLRAILSDPLTLSGRKEVSYVTEPVESLRAILSDPLTGVLMDDAMILSCGHSFSNGGLKHVISMKACCTCLHDVTEDSASPNLLLREVVQAFRREEELHSGRAPKRRRERYDQEKRCYGDSAPLEHSRRKGVQFPFALTDRVIIKGNKRTPPRFVGREAIVVNQCLNGWYVVKTVDNSEQVKLQYRSLAKVPDAQCSKPT